MPGKFYIKHDLDGRVIKFDKSKLQIKLGNYKKPSVFESYEEAQAVVQFFQKFSDSEDASYLSSVLF